MYEEYGLPTVATVCFLLILLLLLLMRLHQGSILAEAFRNSGSNKDYAALLSSDEIDALKENKTSFDDKSVSTVDNKPNDSPIASAPATPFTINSGSSSPSEPQSGESTTGTSSPEPAPSPPFAASVAYIRPEGASPPQCHPVMPGSGGQPITSECYRTYYFGGAVKTSNGPGMVSYDWRSNFAGGNESGNFTAGSGETFTPLQKQVTLPCSQPGTITMRLLISQPNPDASAAITVTHSC